MPVSLSPQLTAHSLVTCAKRILEATEQAWGETFSRTGLMRKV